jgi:hypothetical protein
MLYIIISFDVRATDGARVPVCLQKKSSFDEMYNRSYLKPIIRPTAEFQYARLLIEWEIFYVNFTGTFVNGRRFPFDQTL